MATLAGLALSEGVPVARVRQNTPEAAALQEDEHCSLLMQPKDQRVGPSSRATVLGEARPMETSSEDAQRIMRRMQGMNAAEIGVDEPTESDLLFAVHADWVLLCGEEGAEWVAGTDFEQASPDPLCEHAIKVADDFNSQLSPDDLLRIANASPERPGDLASMSARIVWVDRSGIDLRADFAGAPSKILRVPFQSEVRSPQEARSAITMLSQVLWESDHSYVPPSPSVPDETVA